MSRFNELSVGEYITQRRSDILYRVEKIEPLGPDDAVVTIRSSQGKTLRRTMTQLTRNWRK